MVVILMLDVILVSAIAGAISGVLLAVVIHLNKK